MKTSSISSTNTVHRNPNLILLDNIQTTKKVCAFFLAFGLALLFSSIAIKSGSILFIASLAVGSLALLISSVALIRLKLRSDRIQAQVKSEKHPKKQTTPTSLPNAPSVSGDYKLGLSSTSKADPSANLFRVGPSSANSADPSANLFSVGPKSSHKRSTGEEVPHHQHFTSHVYKAGFQADPLQFQEGMNAVIKDSDPVQSPKNLLKPLVIKSNHVATSVDYGVHKTVRLKFDIEPSISSEDVLNGTSILILHNKCHDHKTRLLNIKKLFENLINDLSKQGEASQTALAILFARNRTRIEHLFGLKRVTESTRAALTQSVKELSDDSSAIGRFSGFTYSLAERVLSTNQARNLTVIGLTDNYLKKRMEEGALFVGFHGFAELETQIPGVLATLHNIDSTESLLQTIAKLSSRASPIVFSPEVDIEIAGQGIESVTCLNTGEVSKGQFSLRDLPNIRNQRTQSILLDCNVKKNTAPVINVRLTIRGTNLITGKKIEPLQQFLKMDISKLSSNNREVLLQAQKLECQTRLQALIQRLEKDEISFGEQIVELNELCDALPFEYLRVMSYLHRLIGTLRAIPSTDPEIKNKSLVAARECLTQIKNFDLSQRNPSELAACRVIQTIAGRTQKVLKNDRKFAETVLAMMTQSAASSPFPIDKSTYLRPSQAGGSYIAVTRFQADSHPIHEVLFIHENEIIEVTSTNSPLYEKRYTVESYVETFLK